MSLSLYQICLALNQITALVSLLLADPNLHRRVEISSKSNMTQVRLTNNKGVRHVPEGTIRADLFRSRNRQDALTVTGFLASNIILGNLDFQVTLSSRELESRGFLQSTRPITLPLSTSFNSAPTSLKIFLALSAVVMIP